MAKIVKMQGKRCEPGHKQLKLCINAFADRQLTCKSGQVLHSLVSFPGGFCSLLSSFTGAVSSITQVPDSLGGPVTTLLLEQVGVPHSLGSNVT